MKELDYMPNWFARNLHINKTNLIALLVPDILDPCYMELAKGVEDVARQKDQNIILSTTEEDRNREMKTIESFIERKIDGLIIVSSVLTKKDLTLFRNQKMPVVFIGKNPELTGVNGVLTNYGEAAEEAVNHLIEIGHRRIAMIRGTRPFNENREKSDGYHQAMEKAGLDHSESWVVEEENTIEGGFLAMSKLFSEGRKPEAVFITSDYMAIGAMDKIKQMGI